MFPNSSVERTNMEKLRIQLRAVFYREGTHWIAHCLEMDVMGHGKTKAKALDRMIEAIWEQVCQSVKHNNRANIFMPADAKFFEMYSAGSGDKISGALVLPGTNPQSEEPRLCV